MLLKEIIINGFKSFADRTRIELGPGVTTIVGPNGCGKSNVVDAIRWVLGEQSAKSLRGGKMEDVIFAGTEQRQASLMCEVTLLFTDCEKELGTAFNEVEITRRVLREGASDYYLNGKACRLKDIQELFMNTGVGRVSYSFMVQGQIDQILSTNPEERRVIFEEAAGITRYKFQRREALSKLAQVDQNLSRVQDIVDEVRRQMESLKRQASKAIRYKKIKHRLDALVLAFNSYSYRYRYGVIEGLTGKARELRVFVEGLQGGMEVDEGVLIEKKQLRSGLYERLQNFQQEVFDIKSRQDRLKNQSSLALVRKGDAERRIGEIGQELKIIKKQLEELESKVKDDGHIKQLQLDLVYDSDVKFQEKSKEVEGVQRKLLEVEGALQDKKKAFLKIEGELSRSRSYRSQLEVALNTSDHQIKDLVIKREEAWSHQEEFKKNFEWLERSIESQERVCEEVQNELKHVQLNVIKEVDALKELQKRLQEQDRQMARLNVQVSALEGLQAKFEGFSDGAKAILQGKLGGIDKSMYALLGKSVAVEEVYAKALEVLLGQAIDAIALEELGQVGSVIAQLKEKGLGQACLSVAVGGDFRKKRNKLPDFLKPALEVVEVKDTQFLRHWEPLLQGCYFADSLEAFLDFWQSNSNFEFHLVVTLSGELIDARGLIYGGGKGGKVPGSGFLQREAEIRVLNDKVIEQKKILDTLIKDVKRGQKRVEEEEKSSGEVRERVLKENEKISLLRVEYRQAQVALERNEQTVKRIDDQLLQIKQSHLENQKRLGEGQEGLERLESALKVAREAIDTEEELINRMRLERDKEREIVSEMRIELAQRRQKLEVVDQGISENEKRRKDLLSRYDAGEKDRQRLGEEVERLSCEFEDCSHKAIESQKLLGEAMVKLEGEREGLVLIEGTIKELEERLAGIRKELQVHEGGLRACEVELAKEHSELNHRVEKVREEFGVELESVDWKEALWRADEEFELRVMIEEFPDGEEWVPKVKRDRGRPTDEDLERMEGTDWEGVKKEIKELSDRVSAMGSVNLVAIEEYVALKERFEFLEKQCSDLKGAKEQLIGAIEEINRTSQGMFKETFEKVRQNFKFTFDALFGGGVADLELIESEDVLESGIEIIARPPGTKLKGLTLLSGGQKTMTAVALLFAIYKVKPSPFCVLDELDAPLDDANIGRFTAMLREFTRYSQFLVISHNRRTISASDTIYGVTMQNSGVTSLMSMRFNKKDRETGLVEGFIEKEKTELAEV